MLNLDQYNGLWAIEEQAAWSLLGTARRINWHAYADSRERVPYQPKQQSAINIVANPSGSGGVAIIDIEGSLAKKGMSITASSSLIQIRRNIQIAARDASIKGIVIRIDSPGGTVAGTADAGRAIREAAKAKPVIAFVEDQAASAAYWLAAQATEIIANDRTATVGSIGTFIGTYDLSGMAEDQGIKAIMIKSGEFKGMGFPGTEITDAQKAVLQSIVDQTQQSFDQAVSKGRGMAIAEVRKLADGRSHLADAAIDMGLVDRIGTLEQAVARARQTNRKSEDKKMEYQLVDAAGNPVNLGNTEQTETPAKTAPAKEAAATLAELKETFPEGGAEFREACLEQGLTLTQAATKYGELVTARLEAVNEREKALEKKMTAHPGVEPLGQKGSTTADEGSGDPVEQFEGRVKALTDKGASKPKAIRQVVIEDPELHKSYLQAYTEKHRAV